ncbi:MAG TPA: hypothetical protein VF086_09700 [Propionibacteriaceae bacterium]
MGLHTVCQCEKFVIRQGKDGVRDAGGSPELIELGERAIDDRADGLGSDQLVTAREAVEKMVQAGMLDDLMNQVDSGICS